VKVDNKFFARSYFVCVLLKNSRNLIATPRRRFQFLFHKAFFFFCYNLFILLRNELILIIRTNVLKKRLYNERRENKRILMYYSCGRVNIRETADRYNIEVR
jgi:hypothetical protein